MRIRIILGSWIRIRIRIKVESWIRISIRIQEEFIIETVFTTQSGLMFFTNPIPFVPQV